MSLLLRVPQSTCEAVFRLLAALPALRRRGLLRPGVLLGNTGSAAAGGHLGRYQVGGAAVLTVERGAERGGRRGTERVIGSGPSASGRRLARAA